jgi:subtilisin family serine protease
MDPLSQTRLQALMAISSGDPSMIIGLIDGPVDYSHADFQGSQIRAVRESQLTACKNSSSIACRHGSFIAGMLCAKRGSSAPALCPNSKLLLRPLFGDQTRFGNINSKETFMSNSTPEELSDAIIEMVDSHAKIINLSLGLSSSSLKIHPKLEEAYDYAREHEVIIVAASGNQGNIGSISLTHNQWIIPVVACDGNGRLDPISNIGRSIGIRGLMAPGVNVRSVASGGVTRE